MINKSSMVKCIFREVKSYNFLNKIVSYFCEDRFVLAISVDPDEMVHTVADCQSNLIGITSIKIVKIFAQLCRLARIMILYVSCAAINIIKALIRL